MSAEPMVAVDPWWQRVLWRGLTRSDRLIGLRRARDLASTCIRVGARTRCGYTKGVLRVAARHVSSKAPGLEKLPERWWQKEPIVHVRRLGIDIELDLRDNLQRVVYYTGTYEPQVLGLLRRELGPGAVFIDVGAHIGIHSLVVAKHVGRLGGGRVYAFEPAPDSASRIRATAARNALDITVIQTALGAERGTVELFGDDRYDEADTGVRSQYGAGTPIGAVPVISFDDWAADMGLDQLDAIKIDVEGAEALVIEGMCQTLEHLRPKLLIIELKVASLARADVDHVELRARVASLGYRLRGLALFGNEVFESIS